MDISKIVYNTSLKESEGTFKYADCIKYFKANPIPREKLLIKNGYGRTLLHIALSKGCSNIEFLKLLIIPEVLTMVDKYLGTPVHFALWRHYSLEIIKLLTTPDVLVTVNNEGLTPLHYALWMKLNNDFIKFL